MGSLTGVYHLAVHGDEPAFEAVMTEHVMPSVRVRVLIRGVSGVSQELVKLFRETGAPQYRWSVTLRHFGSDPTESVGSAVPAIFPELVEHVSERIEPYAVYVGFELNHPGRRAPRPGQDH